MSRVLKDGEERGGCSQRGSGIRPIKLSLHLTRMSTASPPLAWVPGTGSRSK